MCGITTGNFKREPGGTGSYLKQIAENFKEMLKYSYIGIAKLTLEIIIIEMTQK